ncbi:MAG TPA: NAD(+)/NADH kinase, partial [Oligoflexia bacterium]|nr:NAD(+)/NADH kinase [Oligoflexia bacterium]
PLTQALLAWLEARQVPFRVDIVTAQNLGLTVAESVLIARECLSTECSPLVILGGDGTFISVCRHPAPRPPVVIGVNLGTLGFLTDITTSELYSVLEAALAGRAQVEPRRLLSAAVECDGIETERFTALNDIVISKETLARIFTTDVFIDGAFAAPLRGDGVIVASPSGSTAYSLAAGGSIVHPGVDAILLSPICSHSLTTRPLVLPGNSVIELRPADIRNVGAVFLSVDGQEGRPLIEGEQVRVTTSSHSFLFAKSPSKSYYEVLGAKLKWAAR